MSESHGRHAVPDADAAATLPYPDDISQSDLPNPKATRTVRFWTVPIVITVVVLAALAVFYLGATLRPMTNLRHFPIAVVNEDAGPTGAQVVKGLLSGFEKDDAYDVRVLSHDGAKHQLDTARIYGVAVIPPNFSSKLQAYAKSALTPGASTGPSFSSRRIRERAPWEPASPTRPSLVPSSRWTTLWANGFHKK